MSSLSPDAPVSARPDAAYPRPDDNPSIDAAIRALDAAEQLGQPAALALTLAQVGRAYRTLGDAASAEWYLQQGLRWAYTLGAADTSIELLCDLAETAADRADHLPADDARLGYVLRERARDHSFQAAQLAARAADPQWESTVLLRASAVLHRCGDVDDAASLQHRATDALGRLPGRPTPAHAALVTN